MVYCAGNNASLAAAATTTAAITTAAATAIFAVVVDELVVEAGRANPHQILTRRAIENSNEAKG